MLIPNVELSHQLIGASIVTIVIGATREKRIKAVAEKTGTTPVHYKALDLYLEELE